MPCGCSHKKPAASNGRLRRTGRDGPNRFFQPWPVNRNTPNGPSGPQRFCAVQAFSPAAKTLAQAEFTAQPSAALLPYGCGAPLAGASAQHLDHRRVEPPTGRRNPKRRTSAFSRCPSFWTGRLKSIFFPRQAKPPRSGGTQPRAQRSGSRLEARSSRMSAR